MAHTKEQAFYISKEYQRFSKYTRTVKVALFCGDTRSRLDAFVLNNNCPHIIVGTPGRIKTLVRYRALSLRYIKHFILDDCDQIFEAIGTFSKQLFNLNLRNPPVLV